MRTIALQESGKLAREGLRAWAEGLSLRTAVEHVLVAGIYAVRFLFSGFRGLYAGAVEVRKANRIAAMSFLEDFGGAAFGAGSQALGLALLPILRTVLFPFRSAYALELNTTNFVRVAIAGPAMTITGVVAFLATFGSVTEVLATGIRRCFVDGLYVRRGPEQVWGVLGLLSFVVTVCAAFLPPVRDAVATAWTYTPGWVLVWILVAGLVAPERKIELVEELVEEDSGVPQLTDREKKLLYKAGMDGRGVDPEEFEALCAGLLRLAFPEDKVTHHGVNNPGIKVASSGDGGVDIRIVRADGSVVLIDAKRYKNSVGVEQYKKLAGTCLDPDWSNGDAPVEGWIIAPVYPSDDAKSYAARMTGKDGAPNIRHVRYKQVLEWSGIDQTTGVKEAA